MPILWAFTYKIDNNGYLIRFKAHIYIQGNLQESTYKNIYTATLTAKLFRVLMAIIVVFNLDY